MEKKQYTTYTKFFSEAAGTFFFVFVAAGGAMASVHDGSNSVLSALSGSLAGGLGLLAAISMTAPVSGGHLNPAVSLSAAILKQLEWRLLPVYVTAQLLGALAAALLLQTTVFETFGLEMNSPWFPGNLMQETFLIEAILSVGLFLVIYANAMIAKNPGGLLALTVGSYVVAVGIAFGSSVGAYMNPARALAPFAMSNYMHADEKLATFLLYTLAPVFGMTVIALVVRLWTNVRHRSS